MSADRTVFEKGAWSPGRFGAMLACPERHYLRYNMLLRQKVRERSDALEIGSRVHRVLELVGQWAAAGHVTDRTIWDRAILWVHAEAKQALADSKEQVDYKLHEKLCNETERLIRAYINEYGPVNAGYGESAEVLAVEETLTFYARDLCGAVIDVLVRQPSGLFVYEHKTAARALPRYAEADRQLKTRVQYAMQAIAVQDNYSEIPTVIHNEIRKTNTVGFSRVAVMYTPQELHKWWALLAYYQEQATLDPVRNPASCAGFFPCDYLDYCYGTPEEREMNFEIRKEKG